MNKLLLTLKRDYNDSIILVANNRKDLEDYLRSNYNFYKITVSFYEITVVKFALNQDWVYICQK